MPDGEGDRLGRLAFSKPSVTARAIADARSRFDRPSVAGGDGSVGTLLSRDLGKPLPVQRLGGFVSYVRGRTLFFDDHVRAAVTDGPVQVVIVGAGYDDRPHRFRSRDARFIEVDHPATQADKRMRIERLGVDDSGICYIAADIERDSLDDALSAELDPAVPTMFLCESVLPYLRRESGQNMLRSLSRIVGPSVQLVADLPVVPTSWSGRATFAGFRLFGKIVGEPVRTALPAADVASFLDAGGWRETQRVTGEELGMPRGRAEWLFVVGRPAGAG